MRERMAEDRGGLDCLHGGGRSVLARLRGMQALVQGEGEASAGHAEFRRWLELRKGCARKLRTLDSALALPLWAAKP